MIYDTLDQLASYIPNYDRIAEFMERTDFHKLPDGKIDIDGDNVYANIQTYETRQVNADRFEVHCRYIDVQFLIDGDFEMCGVAVPASNMEILEEYDNTKDIAFGRIDNHFFVPITKKAFALFTPNDAHLPGRFTQGMKSSTVRKCVLKIKMDCFEEVI